MVIVSGSPRACIATRYCYTVVIGHRYRPNGGFAHVCTRLCLKMGIHRLRSAGEELLLEMDAGCHILIGSEASIGNNKVVGCKVGYHGQCADRFITTAGLQTGIKSKIVQEVVSDDRQGTRTFARDVLAGLMLIGNLEGASAKCRK